MAAPPFDFWPHFASRINGLGGQAPSDDPDYAFHTTYVRANDGDIAFCGRFEGLAGTGGTLILRINEFPLYPNGRARQAAVKQLQIRDLALEGGRFEIDAEARAGFSYAVFASLYGDFTVKADALTIEAELRPAEPGRWRQPTSGVDRIKSTGALVSGVEPMLASPTSQPFTPAQLREPAFRDQARALGLPADMDPLDQWSRVYIASVWRAYDLIEPGTRALGLDAAVDPLVTLLERADARPALLAVLSQDPEQPGESAEPVDREIAAHDLVWSIVPPAAARTWSLALRYIDHSLMRLKGGGWAVHVLPFAGAVDTEDGDPTQRTGPLLRYDMERIAMVLVSRGHQVAQLRVGKTFLGGSDTGESAFGLAIRKRV